MTFGSSLTGATDSAERRAQIVENTLVEPYRTQVEEKLLKAVRDYPESAHWTLSITRFHILPGFRVMICSAAGLVGTWVFDHPGEPIAKHIQDTLGPPEP